MLDTNVAIHLRDGDPAITDKVAAQHRATLVTMNPEDFADVPELPLLAW